MPLPTNAKLTFSVPVAGAGGVDCDGNPIANSKAVIVLASLREDNDPRSLSKGAAGLDPGAVKLVGRANEPKFLPELPREAAIELTDPVTGQKVTGIFKRDLPLQSKFRGVTAALGTKIEGVFVEDRGY